MGGLNRFDSVRRGSVSRDGLCSSFSAEGEEYGRGYSKSEQGRADEAANDDHGDRVKYFFARFSGSEDQWDQRYASGQCSHEHGHESFLGPSLDHLLGEAFAFVSHEVKVMGQHHDGITRGDAGDGDEPDEGSDADRVESPVRQEDAANHGDGDVCQDEEYKE